MVSSSVRFEFDPRLNGLPKDIVSDVLPFVLDAFLADTKAKAGGPTVKSAPRGRLPILTGRLIESLHWRGLKSTRPVLWAVAYANYLPLGGAATILRTALVNFQETKSYAAALRRGARAMGRAP